MTRLEELHGRGHREALEKLHAAVEEARFAAVTGARRVGKTSVVKTLLNTYHYPYIYFDLSPYMGRRAVSLRALVPAEIGFREERLSAEAQLGLHILTVQLRRRRVASDVFQDSLLTLLRELGKTYERFVLVFDEAQVLLFVKGISARGLLQFIHNNYPGIVVILTGSMPGLLDRLIRPPASEPGFARYIEEIRVPRWAPRETVEYLEAGLREAGIDAPRNELEETHWELGGVPGFIAYYGLLRLSGKPHHQALAEAAEHAAAQWQADLEAFLRIYNSPLYVEVLAALSAAPTGLTWSEVRRAVAALTSREPAKSALHRVLSNLESAGMVEKTGDRYRVVDASLRRAAERLSRGLRGKTHY